MGGSYSKTLIGLLFASPLTLGNSSSCNLMFAAIKRTVSFAVVLVSSVVAYK